MKKKKYLIFAHYHSKGLIRKDILEFLKKSNFFFDKIIFVSTNLKVSERKKFPRSIKIISRKNIGYDFYSYKHGLNYFILNYLKKESENADLYFLNSSVLIVETNKLIGNLKKLKIKNNEIWGLTKSYELTEHLQSYFFCFSVKVLKNKNILNWWLKIKPYKKRQTIIDKYELGLSKIMKTNDYKLCAMFSKNINIYPKNIIQKIKLRYKEVLYRQKKIYKKNPTNYFWKDFYTQFGLIKIELLKLNPKNIDLADLIKIIKKKKKLIHAAINN